MKQTLCDITLGNRQLTFGFTDERDKGQTLVADCVHTQLHRQGYAVLSEQVEAINTAHGLYESDILQYIFWMAEDLKIQFRIEDQNLSAVDTLKQLRTDPSREVTIVPVQKVAQVVLEDVAAFYQALSGPEALTGDCDQYRLARQMVQKINSWEKRLRACLARAQKPHFPGAQEIAGHLDFIQTILARRDAYAVITTVAGNKAPLLELRERVQTISAFYDRHSSFWEMLVQSMAAFDQDLDHLATEPRVARALEDLRQIINANAPYDAMQQVVALFKTVKARHDEIVEEKIAQRRGAETAKVEGMIQRMGHHLDACRASPDLRNQTLYALRQIAIHLAAAETIARIEQLAETAHETFDNLWVTVKEKG